MSVWRWAEQIDEMPQGPRVTLGEGETPVIASRSIGPDAGMHHLWFKLESANPSGSYKDRFAAVAVSSMLADQRSRCIATSSGNTGSALASYCAAARIRCQIAIVENAPLSKLLQMQAHGAELVRIRGFGSHPAITQRVFQHLSKLADLGDAGLQISAFRYSPLGMRGVLSISFELGAQIPAPIDHVFCPAGGGGLTLAVVLGFERLVELNPSDHVPRVECVQPAGNDTIAGPLRQGKHRAQEVTCTSSISGLQVPSVVDGHQVIRACRRTGGTGHLVRDDEILAMQARLARDEGIFCEPAAAASVAGALIAFRQGELDPEAHVACLITGSGFKDAPSLERMSGPACAICDLDDLDW